MRSDRKRNRKRKHRLAKFFIKLLVFIVFLAGAMLGALTLLDYNPSDSEMIIIAGTSSARPNPGDTIKLLSWNIGYASLGDNASYFLDGGKDVFPSDEDRVNQNLAAITAFLNDERADIALLQEVDHKSRRSHNIDQSVYIRSEMEGAHTATFANNYKSYFLPYPIPPLGKVDSGILTLSVYDINLSNRISLPHPYSWPMKLLHLKRCLMIDRIPIRGSGKDLIIINLHLEAYSDEESHNEQMKILTSILEEEYARGNYVIAGGDFNHTFSNVNLSKYPQDPDNWAPIIVDTAPLDANWNVLMDSNVPSCRLLDKPYVDADKNTFQYYILDGFIVSKNLKVESLHTEQLNFVNSDHNPVILEVTIPAENTGEEDADGDGEQDGDGETDGEDGEDGDGEG